MSNLNGVPQVPDGRHDGEPIDLSEMTRALSNLIYEGGRAQSYPELDEILRRQRSVDNADAANSTRPNG